MSFFMFVFLALCFKLYSYVVLARVMCVSIPLVVSVFLPFCISVCRCRSCEFCLSVVISVCMYVVRYVFLCFVMYVGASFVTSFVLCSSFLFMYCVLPLCISFFRSFYLYFRL